MKKLFIISNESIYIKNDKYYCDNIDLKSTPEGLNTNFEVNLIARNSSKARNHQINLEKVKTFKSFISFLFGIFSSLKEKESKYLIISISPYTFLACLLLRIFKKKPIVYLRSNGFDEYRIIYGFFGYIIYSLMFFITSKISILSSCRKYILNGKKGHLIHPSQLDNEWKQNHNIPINEKAKLLYVGRLRKEKGIFSLIEIIKDKKDINLTVIGEEENSISDINCENVEILKIVKDQKKLIKCYDNHNIFILPSFTEGQPMALLEALSRLRPVVVFKEIEHVKQGREGIFVSNRNYNDLIKNVNYILQNYNSIQEKMKKNHLPTREQFIQNLKDIINKEVSV